MLNDVEVVKIVKDIECVLGYGSSWDAVHYLKELKSKLQEKEKVVVLGDKSWLELTSNYTGHIAILKPTDEVVIDLASGVAPTLEYWNWFRYLCGIPPMLDDVSHYPRIDTASLFVRDVIKKYYNIDGNKVTFLGE